MRRFWIPLLVVCTAVAVSAQQPTFRAGTQLVSLFATVTDAEKRLVPNLTQEDFEVFDNEPVEQLVQLDIQ